MNVLHGSCLNVWRKSLTAITPECCELYWTSFGGDTPQNSSCTAITKTIQVRRTRHAGHCCGSQDELLSDILLWTPLHGRAKVERPVWTYIQQLCADTGCNLEDLLGAIDDRDWWRERERERERESQRDPCWQCDMMMNGSEIRSRCRLFFCFVFSFDNVSYTRVVAEKDHFRNLRVRIYCMYE